MPGFDLMSILCLVVDNDKFARTFIKNGLLQIGINSVKEASNIAEAEELLHRSKFDLLLLDDYMPSQSGLDFVKELRAGKIADAKNIPVIMITSDISEKTVMDAKNIGVSAYLIKPVSPNVLKKRILFIFTNLLKA